MLQHQFELLARGIHTLNWQIQAFTDRPIFAWDCWECPPQFDGYAIRATKSSIPFHRPYASYLVSVGFMESFLSGPSMIKLQLNFRCKIMYLQSFADTDRAEKWEDKLEWKHDILQVQVQIFDEDVFGLTPSNFPTKLHTFRPIIKIMHDLPTQERIAVRAVYCGLLVAWPKDWIHL